MTDATTDDEQTPGLAGERTDLAWSRSGLAVLAAVAAILKRVVDAHDNWGANTAVVLLLGGGGVAWALAMAHARVIASTSLAGRAHADPDKLRFVAAGTTALALGALVLALVPAS